MRSEIVLKLTAEWIEASRRRVAARIQAQKNFVDTPEAGVVYLGEIEFEEEAL